MNRSVSARLGRGAGARGVASEGVAAGEGQEIGRLLLGRSCVFGRLDKRPPFALLGSVAQQRVELLVQPLVVRCPIGWWDRSWFESWVILLAQLGSVRLAGEPAKARIRASNWGSVIGPLFSTSMRPSGASAVIMGLDLVREMFDDLAVATSRRSSSIGTAALIWAKKVRMCSSRWPSPAGWSSVADVRWSGAGPADQGIDPFRGW